ncbi:TrbG/VirB9 family P-type conjugative transfer protein [Asticcacaulis tiandongensis]|uniref:TrbG/VirB9 family P-type conjugative transfer protein n=1 Tax=Asticcacaulis tiandongensis TaxID=2565365 RepID=UPI00112C02A9|nr:TrbG/VirB9 family P-type conjugative transfer protein [Asticcacaulis tiandongensis]
MRALALIVAGSLTAGVASAASAVPTDPRIRSVDYIEEGVIAVPVSRAVVTRIVLERGEKIVAAATGIPSKCDNEAHVWCIVADANANEVWVKPKTGASKNNLELKTDRRDYSIDLMVGATTTYRVIIRHPKTEALPEPSDTPPDEVAVVEDRLKGTQPVARNLNYTLQSNGKGADITPKAVFDDGVFTYFRFPGNSELPTIFVIGSDGREARVNFTMQDDHMVVQKLGRRFVLRLGKSVVSVWNEDFDPQGVAPVGGTTVAGVRREILGEAQ